MNRPGLVTGRSSKDGQVLTKRHVDQKPTVRIAALRSFAARGPIELYVRQWAILLVKDPQKGRAAKALEFVHVAAVAIVDQGDRPFNAPNERHVADRDFIALIGLADRDGDATCSEVAELDLPVLGCS
jgi:hypothetical protein